MVRVRQWISKKRSYIGKTETSELKQHQVKNQNQTKEPALQQGKSLPKTNEAESKTETYLNHCSLQIDLTPHYPLYKVHISHKRYALTNLKNINKLAQNG